MWEGAEVEVCTQKKLEIDLYSMQWPVGIVLWVLAQGMLLHSDLSTIVVMHVGAAYSKRWLGVRF